MESTEAEYALETVLYIGGWVALSLDPSQHAFTCYQGQQEGGMMVLTS